MSLEDERPFIRRVCDESIFWIDIYGNYVVLLHYINCFGEKLLTREIERESGRYFLHYNYKICTEYAMRFEGKKSKAWPV